MQVDDFAYDMTLNGVKTVGTFIDNGESGIVDLRNTTLKPGQSLIITYRGSLRSFSFGRFDVGYLEDKNDPNTGVSIPAASVKTLNTQASQLASIPERDFYNHDVYGDIRFNPNETCGGPLLLWRSHNTFDRTYYKTLIVRDIQDPDANAVKTSESPTSLTSNPSQSSGTSASSTTTSSETDFQEKAESDLATWQADSDGDYIPDRGDDDHGDVFEIKSSGNSTQISIGLGKVDSMLDDIID